jgi:hypothetical protein
MGVLVAPCLSPSRRVRILAVRIIPSATKVLQRETHASCVMPGVVPLRGNARFPEPVGTCSSSAAPATMTHQTVAAIPKTRADEVTHHRRFAVTARPRGIICCALHMGRVVCNRQTLRQKCGTVDVGERTPGRGRVFGGLIVDGQGGGQS